MSEYGPEIKYPEPMEFDGVAEDFIDDLMRDIYDKSGEMTAREETVSQVSRLITEVNNGGFYQFFYNSSGNKAIDTIAKLNKIGAPQTAELVAAGCRLFPNGRPSQDYRKRREQLEGFSLGQLETLRNLEKKFYSRREDLKLLLKKYWQEKP